MLLRDKNHQIRPLFQIIGGLIAFSLASLPGLFFLTNPLANSLMMLVQVALTLVFFRFLFNWFYQRDLPKTLDCFTLTKSSSRSMLLGLALGVLTFSLSVVPLYLSGLYRLSFNQLDAFSLFASFLLFVTVGYGEELLTRGVMQHALFKYGKWPSLFLTSGLFSLLHIFNPGVTSGALIGVFAAGMTLGLLMDATNSISAAIGFHITWNWIQGSIYGINVSGTISGTPLFRTEIIGHNELLTGGHFGAEASYVTIAVLFLSSLLFYLIGKRHLSQS